MTNECVVFVCNTKYLDKFFFTCSQLINIGNYKKDICLIVGDDLYKSNIYLHPFITDNKIIIKYFKNLQFNNFFLDIQKNLDRPSHWYDKIFQYHKFYLFDVYFKKWDYILYIDCGMHIFSDINFFFNLGKKNILFANRDGIDGEDWDEKDNRNINKLVGNGIGQSMKLHSQFVKLEP